MDLGLSDRVYIVTGASRGLGRACARVLAEEGARLVIASRDRSAITATAESLGTTDRVLALPIDLSDAQAPEQCVAAAVGRFGRVDGALISVGGPAGGNLLDTSDDAWRTSFESVFLGAVRTAKAVARGIGTEGGSIVFVLSSSAKSPVPGLAISNGLRPGLAMVAKTLADELGSRAIRVNSALPGRIDTDRTRELDASASDPGGARQSWEAQIPLGRYGYPEEFARAAVFLLSPAASYVTGTALAIDGGMLRTY
ncbi:MAG: SDR family oxidoreductase [Actinomycetales bacterium]